MKIREILESKKKEEKTVREDITEAVVEAIAE